MTRGDIMNKEKCYSIILPYSSIQSEDQLKLFLHKIEEELINISYKVIFMEDVMNPQLNQVIDDLISRNSNYISQKCDCNNAYQEASKMDEVKDTIIIPIYSTTKSFQEALFDQLYLLKQRNNTLEEANYLLVDSNQRLLTQNAQKEKEMKIKQKQLDNSKKELEQNKNSLNYRLGYQLTYIPKKIYYYFRKKQ